MGGGGGNARICGVFAKMSHARLLARIVVIQGSIPPSRILNNNNEALYGNGLTTLQTMDSSRARPRWQDIELCKCMGCLFASKPRKTQDKEY